MRTNYLNKPPSKLEPPTHRVSAQGKIVSLMIFIAYFTVVPELVKFVWPTFTHIFHHDIYYVYWGLVIAVNVGVFGTYNLVMYFIYKFKIPFFERYRCSQKLFPWESDAVSWRKKFKKSLLLVLFNMFVVNSIMPFLDQVTSGGKLKYLHSIQTWPSTGTILFQFIFFMLVEDIVFFCSHYMFHKPALYWIHKVHHEYNITVTLAATSAHPFEYLFGNAIPTGLGYSLLVKFMPVHCVTIAIWLIFRSIETCQGHCGYDWSWGSMSFFPWKLDSSYHNFHHEYNIGNYGSMFGFWDNLMETNGHYKAYQCKKNAMEQEQNKDQ